MFKILVLVAVFAAIFYSIKGDSRSSNVNGHPKNPCLYVLCPHGTHCVNKERQCTTNDCPRIAVCEAQKRFPNFCNLPPDEGKCPTSFPTEDRWFYNSTCGRCRKFRYNGCRGNENNYLSYMHCERSCVRQEECFLKKETGECRARFIRWYYDIFASACREFVYGGCGGNGNNFPTINACMNKCFVSRFEIPEKQNKLFEEGDILEDLSEA